MGASQITKLKNERKLLGKQQQQRSYLEEANVIAWRPKRNYMMIIFNAHVCTVPRQEFRSRWAIPHSYCANKTKRTSSIPYELLCCLHFIIQNGYICSSEKHVFHELGMWHDVGMQQNCNSIQHHTYLFSFIMHGLHVIQMEIMIVQCNRLMFEQYDIVLRDRVLYTYNILETDI